MTIQDKNKVLNFLIEISGNDKEISYISNLVDAYPDILDYMLSDRMPDLTNVKYVKYKRYNQLKEKVLENRNILDLNKQLNDLFSLQLLSKIKKHYQSKFDYDDVLINFIAKRMLLTPYDLLCSIPGISFIKADKIILTANDDERSIWNQNLRYSISRCTSFIIYYLINELNGSTYCEISQLKQSMQYKYNLSECLSTIELALQDKRFVIFENSKIMLSSVYYEELNIAKYVKNAIDISIQHNYGINTNQYRKINSFLLSDSQMHTLELINTKQLVLLNGYAGTGKSSSIKALINMLEDNGKTFTILSPTAKAAKQISLYTQRPASTIHYLLCREFPDFDRGIKDVGEYEQIIEAPTDPNNLEFSTLNNQEILDYDVIIIDEVSMLSVQLFNMLLRYINPSRTKLLLIGDSYQLPSIQNGNLYQDLLEISEIPKVTLNEIHRYKEDGLVTVATNIRLGERYLDNNTDNLVIGESFEFTQCNDTLQMINSALAKYMELIQNGDDIQDIAILTAKNIGASGTNVINSCVQRIINPINEFDNYISIKVDNTTIRFKQNDVVMNIKNNYNAISEITHEKKLIANGQIGVIKWVDPFINQMCVKIDDDEFIFEYEDIRNIRLAYCFTIHKSQGSQFKHVIYIVDANDIYMTNSNLMYVAVTRATDAVYQFGVRHVINYKINERINLKRNTTLKEQFYNIKVG